MDLYELLKLKTQMHNFYYNVYLRDFQFYHY